MPSKIIDSSYVQGVGDELLWVLGVGTITMATLVTSTVMLLRQTSHNQQINPHHHGDVEATRRQLGVTSPQGGHNPPPGDGHDSLSDDRHDLLPSDRHDSSPDNRRGLPPGDRNCPICLTQMIAAVETNCGHTFCGV